MAKQLSAAKIAKAFAETSRKLRTERQNATRTLSPDTLRQAIKSGEVSPEMEVLIGKKRDGSSFTADDLKDFAKARDKVQKKSTQGVKIDQLIAASRPDDVKRANGSYQPRAPNGWVGNLSRGAARLYQAKNGILSFSVKASGDGPDTSHKCRVKLLNWDVQLSNPNANQNTAASNALNGPVKIDCSCKRHQFWYRYLAGVGGYALSPPVEKDFPKEKNPGLTGAVCKHAVAVFQVIRTPTYKALIAKKMQSERKTMGFGTTKKAANLTRAEIRALGKSKPRQTNQEKYQEKIQSALRKSMSTQKQKADLKAEVRKLKAREKTLNKKLEDKQSEVDKLNKARQSLGRKSKSDIQAALSDLVGGIAESQGMTKAEAAAFIVAQLGGES